MQRLSEEAKKNKKNTIALYILTVLLVAQFAVPTYGIIKDFLGQDEYVFVLGESSVHAEIEQRKPSDVFGAMLDRLFPPGEGSESLTPGGGNEGVSTDPDTGSEELPGTKPDKPARPDKPSTPDSPVTPGGLDVEDDDIFYSDSADINVFGDRKRIAPGDAGTYRFQVQNKSNGAYVYDVVLNTKDTLPDDAKIPMEFRLQRDGAFVTGSDAWTGNLTDLYDDQKIEAGKQVTYTLNWRWAESDNDNRFIPYAANEAYAYTLTVTVSAEAA